MKIRFKLYALLTDYLPAEAKDHSIDIDVDMTTSIIEIIERFGIPLKMAHLVLLNGVYVNPEDRTTKTLTDGDTLAIWPPVAGG